MLAVKPTALGKPCSRVAGRVGGRRRGRGFVGARVYTGQPNSTDSFAGFSSGSTYNPNSQRTEPEFNLVSLAPVSDPHQTPEVVWGPGKSPDQIATKLLSLTERQRVAMAARIDPATYSAVRMHAPGVEYNARALTLKLRSATADQLPKQRRLPGSVAIISADTADQAVAEEVKVLTDYMGGYCFQVKDVGTQNLHGLLSNVDSLRAADVVVVVAGTDIGLPSLVAGLVQSPVIAVPTSAGFGASLGGLAPLLANLSANTPGVMLCNVDNGYGAASMAIRMLKMASRLHNVRSAAEAAAAAAEAAARAMPKAVAQEAPSGYNNN